MATICSNEPCGLVRDAAAGQGDLTLGMRYLDQLVVAGGRWVIRSRSSRVVWMR